VKSVIEFATALTALVVVIDTAFTKLIHSKLKRLESGKLIKKQVIEAIAEQGEPERIKVRDEKEADEWRKLQD
jgi:hypothetical protein